MSERRGLELEQASQACALAAARESLQLTGNQFDAGLVDFLSLAQTQATALSAERQALDLESQRLRAAVKLMVALGGGWDAQTGLTPEEVTKAGMSSNTEESAPAVLSPVVE